LASRLGVDVGGTFTDVVIYNDRERRIELAKGPSTPAAPDEGVLEIVSALPRDLRTRCRLFVHGTTVGLNALLERRGATVGLLATAGFRDVLAMRRGDRDLVYDVSWRAPAPLVPRRLRLGVRERVRAWGEVETPLEPADVIAAAAEFERAGVEAVAVALINAYANPEHELAAEALLREAGFQGEISLSHRLSGEYREYERTSTAAIDAYIRPQVASYLRRLELELERAEVRADCFITRSGGGVMRFAEAATRPFESIMSGPVGGAVGAARICRALGVGRGITADVGGTSFDTCLIVDAEPTVRFEGSVAGMPIQTPWVDVRSIGAGGGSIATIDPSGRLRVGPESAGARPGPVAYGRGGERPTVTDAAAALGMFGYGELAGGLRLDVPAAVAALERLGGRLGMDAVELSRGIVSVAVASMGMAMRSVTIEQGEDPREAHLIAFGGAGPLLATLLADELDVPSIVIPPFAGNFSAWGLLDQDLARSLSRTLICPLEADSVPRIEAVAAELFASLEEREGGTGNEAATLGELALEVRYHGQEHTLNVAADWDGGRLRGDLGPLRKRFEEGYRRTFGSVLEEELEVVAVRATARLPLPEMEIEDVLGGGGDSGAGETVQAFSFTASRFLPFATHRRDELAAGASLRGPAIICEETSTTYLDAGYEASVHSSGALLLARPER